MTGRHAAPVDVARETRAWDEAQTALSPLVGRRHKPAALQVVRAYRLGWLTHRRELARLADHIRTQHQEDA